MIHIFRHRVKPRTALLRTGVEAQIAAWEESSQQARGTQRPPERAPGAGTVPTGPGMRGDRSRRRGRRGAAPEAMRNAPRAPSAEAMLAPYPAWLAAGPGE